MICKRCKEKPTVHPRSELCVECRPIVKKEIRDRANRKSNERKKAERAAQDKRSQPCRCGCGVMVAHPKKWSPKCRETSKKVLYAVHLQTAKDKRREKAAAKAAANGEAVKEKSVVKPVPVPTLKDTIAEANQMRERRDRLPVDLLNNRLWRGAFR
jgi:hypothetical protein